MKEISRKLIGLCDTIPAILKTIPAEEFSLKPVPHKWSKKEILGHLIDSAANNHQRFIRAQFETPVIFYEQDLWVSIQNYQSESPELLIFLWEAYNRHLAHVIEQIPQQNLSKTSIGKDGTVCTLEFLINDYLNHLEFHLEQICISDQKLNP